jgi:hypothetical protein
MTKKNKSRADSEISNSAASLPLIFFRPAAGRNRRWAWLRVHGK